MPVDPAEKTKPDAVYQASGGTGQQNAAADGKPKLLKVLIHVPRLDIAGGKQGLFLALTPHFHHSVTYFTYGSRGKKEGKAEQGLRLLMDYWRFFKDLGQGGYQVVHLNPSMSRKPFFRDMIFMCLAKWRCKPTVVFWHGWDWKFLSQVESKYMGFFRQSFGKADAMIVLSSEMEKALQRIAPALKVYRKTTCPDTSLAEGLDAEKIANRYRGGRPLRLLFLARLEREKGIFECLYAFEALKKTYPGLSLCIAGDGAASASVRQYIGEKQLSDVEMLGFISGLKKKAALLESDIYLFPSYYPEGLPVSLLEAMSCGLPVLTTDVGGIKDEFVEGRMGFFVPPRDEKALISKLRYLLHRPTAMKEIALFNYRYANNKYAAAKVAQDIETVYQEVSGIKPAALVQQASQDGVIGQGDRGSDRAEG